MSVEGLNLLVNITKEVKMKYLNNKSNSYAIFGVLTLASTIADAHTGHATTNLFEGLRHPLGLDHLLAMLAVGIWSVSALPAKQAWWGPAIFMISLTVSATLGTMGVTVPYLEQLVSLSVVIFGVMLVALQGRWSPGFGLGLVGLAASLHGLAHGIEAPSNGFSSYVGGFLLTTAVLHFGGVLVGIIIRRRLEANHATWVLSGLGALIGGTGLHAFMQV
jgi:urease accessory protein